MGLRLKPRLDSTLSARRYRSTDTHTSDPGKHGRAFPFAISQPKALALLSTGCWRRIIRWRVLFGVSRPVGWLVCGRKPIPALRSSMHCNAGKPCNQRLATSNPIFCRRPSRKYRYPEDSIALAYERGVPMGGDLAATQSPRFWVWAAQDPRKRHLIASRSLKVGCPMVKPSSASGMWFVQMNECPAKMANAPAQRQK